MEITKWEELLQYMKNTLTLNMHMSSTISLNTTIIIIIIIIIIRQHSICPSCYMFRPKSSHIQAQTIKQLSKTL